jgi:hypothetical protein
MTIFSVNAPTVLEPERLGIGFDTETWDFYIFRNGVCVALLEPGESQALLLVIQKATAQGKPADEVTP